MPDKRKLILSALLAFGLLGLCLPWLFFKSNLEVIGSQIDVGAPVDAGPMADGVRLQQAIDIPEGLNSDWLHVGFRFATYARNNTGRIIVKVSQGALEHEHTVRSSRLEDNAVAYFAVPGLQPGKAQLTIEGLDGLSSNSATVWCRYATDLSPMLLNGEASDRRVDVWFALQWINKDFFPKQVGMGGLIFLTVVVYGILTLVFYRGWVELASGFSLGSDVGRLLSSLDLRRCWISIPVSLLAGALVALVFYWMSEQPVHFKSMQDRYSDERVPIDPLIEGTTVEQSFEITPEMARGEIGLGLSFGTYLRKNKAKLELKVTQGEASDRLIVNSKTLENGLEQIFVFSQFQPGEATLTITGINGTGSISPTVWFEPGDQEPRAIVNGEVMPQRLILYRYRVVTEERGYVVGGYRFPLKWVVVTVGVVFILLQFLWPKRRAAA